MQIAKHLAMAVIGLVLASPTTPPLRAETGIVRSTVKAPVTINAPSPSIDRQVRETLSPPCTTFRCGTGTGCR